MMSIASMNAAADRAAARAKRENLLPMMPGTRAAESAERMTERLRSTPFIGTHRPDSLRLVQPGELKLPDSMSAHRLGGLACQDPYLLVDNSGFGAANEPALTYREFVEPARANPLLRYAIVEAGQFQVVIGVFAEKE